MKMLKNQKTLHMKTKKNNHPPAFLVRFERCQVSMTASL
jgi:hypothetical protein